MACPGVLLNQSESAKKKSVIMQLIYEVIDEHKKMNPWHQVRCDPGYDPTIDWSMERLA